LGNIVADEGYGIQSFMEKPDGDGNWINGGFFICEPKVFDYLDGDMDDIMWEESPLIELTNDNELVAYKHHGFWKCMDALRDKNELEKIWDSGNAEWKNWN